MMACLVSGGKKQNKKHIRLLFIKWSDRQYTYEKGSLSKHDKPVLQPRSEKRHKSRTM